MSKRIQISESLQKELINRKFFDSETFEEVIWDLVEDTKEISKQTKKEIAEARLDIKEGKFHTLSQVKYELGL